MIENLLVELGGNAAQQRVSLWKTKSFTATKDDVTFGCEIGNEYTIWVAQKDGTTQSGKEVHKGDWFIVEKES